MTTRPPHLHVRASALLTDHSDTHRGKPNYDLIAHLRSIRAGGDEAMAAVETYDPNFSLKLAACSDLKEAEVLLAAWLLRRVNTLTRTQAELRRIWRETQTSKPRA